VSSSICLTKLLRQVRPGRGGIKLSAAKEQLEKLATCHELPRIILEQRRLAGALAKTVAPLLAVCRQHPKVGLRFLDSYISKESVSVLFLS
jgi:hypothetical protein